MPGRAGMANEAVVSSSADKESKIFFMAAKLHISSHTLLCAYFFFNNVPLF